MGRHTCTRLTPPHCTFRARLAAGDSERPFPSAAQHCGWPRSDRRSLAGATPRDAAASLDSQNNSYAPRLITLYAGSTLAVMMASAKLGGLLLLLLLLGPPPGHIAADAARQSRLQSCPDPVGTLCRCIHLQPHSAPTLHA